SPATAGAAEPDSGSASGTAALPPAEAELVPASTFPADPAAAATSAEPMAISPSAPGAASASTAARPAESGAVSPSPEAEPASTCRDSAESSEVDWRVEDEASERDSDSAAPV